jgi:hypothetical protein
VSRSEVGEGFGGKWGQGQRGHREEKMETIQMKNQSPRMQHPGQQANSVSTFLGSRPPPFTPTPDASSSAISGTTQLGGILLMSLS